MQLPQRFSHDIKWAPTILLAMFLAFVLLFALPAAINNHEPLGVPGQEWLNAKQATVFLRCLAATTGVFFVSTLVGLVRRAVSPRSLELNVLGIVCPSGLTTVEIPYCNIEKLMEVRVLTHYDLELTAYKQTFRISSAMMANPESYLAVKDFLKAHATNAELVSVR